MHASFCLKQIIFLERRKARRRHRVSIERIKDRSGFDVGNSSHNLSRDNELSLLTLSASSYVVTHRVLDHRLHSHYVLIPLGCLAELMLKEKTDDVVSHAHKVLII